MDLGVRQASGDDTYVSLDDITLNGTITAIPEPTSFTLLLLGLAGLLARRRR